MDEMNTKPFPWICPVCREQTVSPVLRDYTMTAEHDGARYDVTVRDKVPTCSRCGEAIITAAVSEKMSADCVAWRVC